MRSVVEAESPLSSRHTTPELEIPIIQPAYFFPPTDKPPVTGSKGYFDPEDDPLVTRGIPVFTPSMEEFTDFEGYMQKVECWGMKSGIVKIIPPKQWHDSLPSIVPLLSKIKIRNSIEQHMMGSGGLFRQNNVEKRRAYSVREWAELCMNTDLRAPTKEDLVLAIGIDASPRRIRLTKRRGRTISEHPPEQDGEIKNDVVPDHVESHLATPPLREAELDHFLSAAELFHLPTPTDEQDDPVVFSTVEADIPSEYKLHTKPEHEEDDDDLDEEEKGAASLPTPASTINDPVSDGDRAESDKAESEKPDPKAAARVAKKARLEARAALDEQWLKTFDPATHWLPPDMKPEDYTPEFCKLLERSYWRNCGLGKPPMYGADLQGSLFTDVTKHWNVAHLPSLLSRLLPSNGSRSKAVPGVNTPYLYWGMWRATFAWHVEDMDLFSINYIHHGAPKHWYAVPQERAKALETTMRGYFPSDTSHCPQFLRHKSFLASPNLLAQSSVKPNIMIQHAGEFVITFPKGYHAGFNLGFNCAESVNFALESWIELGRKARVCRCVGDSVTIDVDQLIAEREAEANAPKVEEPTIIAPPKKSRPPKRKSDTLADAVAPKKLKAEVVLPRIRIMPLVEAPDLPCCLCVGEATDSLLRVQDPPASNIAVGTKPGKDGWKAHEHCAKVVPETWVDEIDGEKVVFGVNAVVKDRWNLHCSYCTKFRSKAHGAPIQCTKGKCPKAYHVSCAMSHPDIHYSILGEVENDVIIIEPEADLSPHDPPLVDVDVAAVDETKVSSPKGPKIIKTIVKCQFELLCPQHNPLLIYARRSAKVDWTRETLRELAKDPESRIRIRKSSGTFEVVLISVDEEKKSVIVQWDSVEQREFRWGSIVWGYGYRGQSSALANANAAASKPLAQRPLAPKPSKPQQSAAAKNMFADKFHTSVPYKPLYTHAPSTSNTSYSSAGSSYPSYPFPPYPPQSNTNASFPSTPYPYYPPYFYPTYIPPKGQDGVNGVPSTPYYQGAPYPGYHPFPITYVPPQNSHTPSVSGTATKSKATMSASTPSGSAWTSASQAKAPTPMTIPYTTEATSRTAPSPNPRDAVQSTSPTCNPK